MGLKSSLQQDSGSLGVKQLEDSCGQLNYITEIDREFLDLGVDMSKSKFKIIREHERNIFQRSNLLESFAFRRMNESFLSFLQMEAQEGI